MAEITGLYTGEFLRELFSILMAAPEGLRASEALQQLASRFTLTPFEAASYESGSCLFERIVRFATVDCVKAGMAHADPKDLVASMHGHEAEAMRLLGEI